MPAGHGICHDPGREFGIPSEHYAEIIREGYQSAGFDAEILEEAIQRAYGLAEKVCRKTSRAQAVSGWDINRYQHGRGGLVSVSGQCLP